MRPLSELHVSSQTTYVISTDMAVSSADFTAFFQDELWSGIRQLSTREQEIIILKDLENRSFQECAEILNMSVEAAKSLRFRAREKLTKILSIGGGNE